MCYELFSPHAQVDVMPALGTHSPMTEGQIRMMFGDVIPLDRFLVHDWRHALTTVGTISSEEINEWSEGKLDYSVDVQVNKILLEGEYDLIVSLGQVVPHEVVGMANYTKNICVGVGGGDLINKSHFLGAVYGSERLMGKSESPPRTLFNESYHRFLAHLPMSFVLTVMEKAEESEDMFMRGLFIGDDDETYLKACELSAAVNVNYVDAPQKKVVVYLTPKEFKSTWLGNKAVYRTRMIIADAGELVILAPGLQEFGEDPGIDALIRKYGYFGTDTTLKQVKENDELSSSLGAAAHLIHGTSDGRFTITYCPGPGLTKDEIESVGYQWGDLEAMSAKYPIDTLRDGVNVMPDGEEIYFVSNPALGLWSLQS
jgi:nickel-dependent lactate racemase